MPEEFSSGEAPGQANFVLRELGFTVEKKDAGTIIESAMEASERGQPWSPEEVDLIVADYFLMLRTEVVKRASIRCIHPCPKVRSGSAWRVFSAKRV
jgi:hypothetical protein